MEKVSILVPVYNAEIFLKECIESILNQTFKELEVILVDDGSTDSSLNICNDYKNKDSRVIVIHNKHEGVVKARQIAINNATSNYVLSVDADDYIEENMVEKLYDNIIKYDADIVVPGYIKEKGTDSFYKSNEIKSGVYSFDEIKNELIYSGIFYRPGVMPYICNKLIRRKLYEYYQKQVPSVITKGDDAAVIFPLLQKAQRIVIDNNFKAYHYRRNSKSLCHTFDNDSFSKRFVLFKYLDEQITDDTLKKQLLYFKLFAIRSEIIDYVNNSKASIFDKNRYLKIQLCNLSKEFRNTNLKYVKEKTCKVLIKAIKKNDYFFYCLKLYNRSIKR